jgi:hypothetical protein
VVVKATGWKVALAVALMSATSAVARAQTQEPVRDTLVITRPTVTSAEGTMGGTTGVSAGQIYFGAGVGMAMPLGDFGDAASPGLSLGGRIDYMITPVISVGGHLTWNGFGGEDDPGAGIEDASFGITQIGAHARWWFPSAEMWTPYVGAGLGFYGLRSEYTVEGIGDVADTDWDLGLNLHGGALFPMGSNFALGGEAAFHNVMADEDAQYLQLAAVARFGWTGVR